MASYYGMVRCIDDNVGKIIDALRQAGVLERTVVVFTADHGDLRGEHHRQNKGVPFEASAKVPFVVYAPGKVPPGSVVNEALSCVDFLPTILSLMGYEVPTDAQGRDACRLLTTGQAPASWKDAVFLRSTSGGSKWLAVVSDRYKLIYSPVDDPWLFDLQEDPDELRNCFRDAGSRAALRELTRSLADYVRRVGDVYAADAKVQADMAWAIDGTGDYVPTVPARPAPKARAQAKTGAKSKNKRAKSNAESQRVGKRQRSGSDKQS